MTPLDLIVPAICRFQEAYETSSCTAQSSILLLFQCLWEDEWSDVMHCPKQDSLKCLRQQGRYFDVVALVRNSDSIAEELDRLYEDNLALEQRLEDQGEKLMEWERLVIVCDDRFLQRADQDELEYVRECLEQMVREASNANARPKLAD